MLKRLFVLAICMSFGGDIMAANFKISEIEYENLKNPTTGYALWNKVIDSFKSDEFINATSSKNEWEESKWRTIFESFISTSLESNLFNLWWGIPKRTAAGKKAKETVGFLINKKPNIEKTIIEELEEIMARSNDCSECGPEDWDGIS